MGIPKSTSPQQLGREDLDQPTLLQQSSQQLVIANVGDLPEILGSLTQPGILLGSEADDVLPDDVNNEESPVQVRRPNHRQPPLSILYNSRELTPAV
jgi:hypothetical protein